MKLVYIASLLLTLGILFQSQPARADHDPIQDAICAGGCIGYCMRYLSTEVLINACADKCITVSC